MKLFTAHRPQQNASAQGSIFVRAIVLLIGITGCCGSIYADENNEFFEEKIRPVLIDYCYKCHSDEADEPAGGLFLHTREGIREGGELGPAVVPEDIDESLLISAMEYRDLEMPPDEQLDDSIIADFRKWIEMGAPDPRTNDDEDVPQPMAKKAPATRHSNARLKHLTGVQFELDKNKHVVGVEYRGTSGFRAMELHKLPRLESVRIAAFTTLSADDVDYLSKLDRVVELRLGNYFYDESVKFEGDLSKLGEMKSLESLFICKHKVVDEDLEFISRLPNLTHLEFNADTNPYYEDGPYVTDECAKYLSKATKLKSLQIYAGDFTDKFVLTLSKNLPELEDLSVRTSQVTEKTLLSLVANCPGLKSLSIRIDEKGIRHLAKAKNLESFSLTSDSLTAEGLRVLADLPQLATAGLNSTKLTNQQLAVFRNHPRLKSLFIDGSELSLEEVLNVIRTMPKLTHLGVGPTNETLQSEINEFLKHRKID